MAANFVIEPNKKGKAAVWKHFGFIKEKEDSAIDNTRVGCRLCMTMLKYSGNTMNLMDHMRHKYPADLQDLKGLTSCSDASSPVTTTLRTAVFVKHFIAFVF